MVDNQRNVAEETKTDKEEQKELSQKIHALVVAGNYALPVVISAFEMLKMEFMMNAFMQHMANQQKGNVMNMQNQMTPDMIEKIKKSKR